MDLKSIVRAFRFGEMQQRADRDPAARRPPTIKFLAVALLIGVLALGFSFLVMTYEPEEDGSTPLTVSQPSGSASAAGPTPATNSTSPEPTAPARILWSGS